MLHCIISAHRATGWDDSSTSSAAALRARRARAEELEAFPLDSGVVSMARERGEPPDSSPSPLPTKVGFSQRHNDVKGLTTAWKTEQS